MKSQHHCYRQHHQNIQMTKTEKNKIQKLKPTHIQFAKMVLKIFIFRRKGRKEGR